MATSSVDICNDALIIIGGTKIASLSDSTKEAILCNEQYSKVRDQLLIAHPWNFAMYRQEIAADADLPSGYWGWAYAHTLSSDVLRVTEMEDDIDVDSWAIEGRKLFADFTPVNILYIKQITDTSVFSKCFEEALAYKLAQRLAYSLTQSSTLQATLKDQAEEALRAARSFDAQEKGLQRVQADDWVNVRF